MASYDAFSTTLRGIVNVDHLGRSYPQCGPPGEQRLVKKVEAEPYEDPIYKHLREQG